MIFNPVAAGGGGGTKNVTVNPGTSVSVESDQYGVSSKITFSGLTKANIKGGCVVMALTPEQNGAVSCGILSISKSGETVFQNYGSRDFGIDQAYSPSSGTVIMKVGYINNGLTNFVLAFD